MLNLHKIYLFVDVTNEKAVHIYQKQNFKIEGTLQEHFYTRGKYNDCHVMGLLRDDWINQQNKCNPTSQLVELVGLCMS